MYIKWNFLLLAFVIFVIFSTTIVTTEDNQSNITNVSNQSNITNIIPKTYNCDECHNTKLKPSGVNLGACASCHENAHNSQNSPSRYGGLGIQGRTIHDEHVGAGGVTGCAPCHTKPTNCNRCHNGHSIPGISNTCVDCHDALPNPHGHPIEHSLLPSGSHNWIKCNNCHQSTQLHFRTVQISVNESIKLCSICHSKQAIDPNHLQNSTCINCHNPHSTGENEHAAFVIIPTATIAGYISNIFDITNKSIIDNFSIIIIALILLSAVLAESYFKDGKK
jgi:hypothetical protein